MEQIYGKDYEVCKQGILGEVAVSLSLKKLTFDVFAPTVEDDSIGKVDLWADPRDGTAFAIQIKTKRYSSDLTVNRIRTDGGGNVIGISDEFRQDMQKMVKYLATAEDLPNTQRIIPLLMIVPGGEYNDNALYNQTTGIPLPEMIDRLYDGIDKAVFSKEEY
jgi:hypothetical protein